MRDDGDAQRTRRPARTAHRRVVGAVAGLLAVATLLVVGCTRTTDGEADTDPRVVSAYRESVSRSAAAAESSAQQAAGDAALEAMCSAFADGQDRAVDAVNTYADAPAGTPEEDVAAGPAIGALLDAAADIEGTVGDPLDADVVADADAYVQAARDLAQLIEAREYGSAYDTTVDRLNDLGDSLAGTCQSR